MSRFGGRVALVTGASRGLGRACALRLADDGADVVVAGRDLDVCRGVADEVRARGVRALSVPLDVTDPTSVRDAVAAAVQHAGHLDLAVNNAGISPAPARIAEADDDVWDAAFDVNTRGAYLCLKHELAHMVGRGSGAVVNVASYAGAHVRVPGIGPYAASKHALVGLTRAAARDHARDGVRVNAVGPGHLRTAMIDRLLDVPGGEESLAERIPMGRVADPAEIAAVVSFLLSDDASFVTGQMLVADGGLSI